MVALEKHADYRLIVAANRDEFYARPAAPAAYWDAHPQILGGRDLQGGGTWLAVNRRGAFAAITNVRKPTTSAAPRSRGLIVTDYLAGKVSAAAFVDTLARSRHEYEGFNVLASDSNSLAWYSNQVEQAAVLAPGVYGLSNHLLDTPWPKVRRIKADFLDAQALREDELVDALFAALDNGEHAPDKELPDTGFGLEFERVLAPIFITGETYGTRCSTVILINYNGQLTFVERRFGPGKAFLGEASYEFEIDAGPP